MKRGLVLRAYLDMLLMEPNERNLMIYTSVSLMTHILSGYALYLMVLTHLGICNSKWPVIIIPHNLPPCKCMNDSFIFMPLFIYGPCSIVKILMFT